jgi:hypothetical protein
MMSSGAISAPFYDAAEGHWHRMLATSKRLELVSADQIAGPYSRTAEVIGLPTWGPATLGSPAVHPGAAVCPWSGDATHFAVFPGTDGTNIVFLFSWDALAWPSAPPQRIELSSNSTWASHITRIHAMIEDPIKHGMFLIFVAGENAAGQGAIGVIQARVQYSDEGQL